MDLPEFNEWLQTHQKAYPSLMDWFAALPDAKGTLSIWFDVLRFVSKAHADEATMRMMRGVEPVVRYTNWHDTPRFISEHAECLKREARPRQRWTVAETDRKDSYRCDLCRDTGVIEVFHGADVKAIRSRKFDRRRLRTAARACTCEMAKRRYAGMVDKGDLAEFNAVNDVAVPLDRLSCSVDSLESDITLVIECDPCGEMTIDEWVAKN